MIVDERLVTFINSFDSGNTEILDVIEKEALDTYVPIVRKEMQSFLKFLLAMTKPMKILEVGTAVGFSSILMATYGPKGCRITTIENYDKRIPIAKDNFKIFIAEFSHNLPANTARRTEIFNFSFWPTNYSNGLEFFFTFADSLEDCSSLSTVTWTVSSIFNVTASINFSRFCKKCSTYMKM